MVQALLHGAGVALAAVLAQGHAAASASAQHSTAQPANFRVVASLDVQALDRSLGEVFSIRTSDNKFHCAAAFVKAVNSRQSTNSNELEFYCRDLSRHEPLEFTQVAPKFRPERSNSSIALYRGTLVDLSQQAYLTRAGTLAPLSGLPDFRNGTVRFFTRLPDGRYLRFVDGFALGKQTCPFTSLVDEAGTYYGSVEVSSYSTTMADRVYVNQRGQLMVSRKLEARRTCTTLRLDPLTKAGSGDWVYGAMPHEGNLIVGGTGTSAPVYRIDPDGAAVVLAQKTPFGVDVSEYYSYLHYGRNLLIGTYPAGDPAVVGKSRSIRLDTSLFPAGSSDYLDRSGDPRRYKRYRELQALASTSGYLLGGMYPWGEVLGVDSLTKRRWRTRVFSHPKRTATRAPYYLEARRQERGFNRGAYDHIEELGKLHRDRVRTGTTDEIPRIHGLFQDAWGQRVSQMVVLSGRVCVSTGSMGDSNFIPQVHTHLTPEKFAEYGRILCAPLDRQVLAGVERPGRLRVTVDILADGIQLQTDGQPHARLGMDNGELLSSLRHGYTMKKGSAQVLDVDVDQSE